MYKSLTRITSPITDIRVERVRDIDNDWNDCLKEGVIGKNEPCCDVNGLHYEVLLKFRELWNSIHEKPKPVRNHEGIVTHYISFPWDDSGKWASLKTFRNKPHYCYPNPWVWVVSF